MYDALVFKTHRIGHGLAYAKHPSLLPVIRDRGIAIEICPASNQILGYVPDLRNHPAIGYYKSGVPIVIAGDDPGSFGYNDLTVDYYLVFMAWGLSLVDLREIANNSIRYSSMLDSNKLVGYTKFGAQWDAFVSTSYASMCASLVVNTSVISFTRVYPSYGPSDASVSVTLYGYGLENTLCSQLTCYFNDVATGGYLNKLNEVVCATPLGFSDTQTVNVSIGYANNMVNTGLKYKFVSSNSIRLVWDYEDVSGAEVSFRPNVFVLVFSMLNLIFFKNFLLNCFYF